MEIQALVTIVTLITAFFGIPRAWREVQQLQDNRLKSDFTLVREYITAVQSDPHPLVVESGFRAVHRGANLNADEILYLLGFSQPSRAMRLFVRGQKYLAFVGGVPQGHAAVGFAAKYTSTLKRKLIRRWYLSTYFALAILAVSPALFAPILFGTNYAAGLLAAVASIVALGGVAGLQLISYSRIYAAERFVEVQAGEFSVSGPNNSSKPTPLRGAA